MALMRTRFAFLHKALYYLDSCSHTNSVRALRLVFEYKCEPSSHCGRILHQSGFDANQVRIATIIRSNANQVRIGCDLRHLCELGSHGKMNCHIMLFPYLMRTQFAFRRVQYTNNKLCEPSSH